MAFITIKKEKLEFTEEQKREYKRLRIIAVSIGTLGLILMIIFYLRGWREPIGNIGLILVIFYAYFSKKYSDILLKSEKTIEYGKFQKELYSKLYRYILPPIAIGGIIAVFVILKFHLNPYLIVVYLIGSGVVAGIWASWYEKKKFGSIKRAP